MRLIFVATALVIGATATAADNSAALRARRPDVAWGTSAIVGDFDCDGRADAAVIGHAAGRVFVGVVMSGAPEPTILEFAVNANEQAAVCSDKASLEMEGQDYDPTDSVGAVDGFVRSKTCKGLRLADGVCDIVHIYWNSVKKRLDWWRR